MFLFLEKILTSFASNKLEIKFYQYIHRNKIKRKKGSTSDNNNKIKKVYNNIGIKIRNLIELDTFTCSLDIYMLGIIYYLTVVILLDFGLLAIFI